MQARPFNSTCVAPFTGHALTSFRRTSCFAASRQTLCAPRPSTPLRKHADARDNAASGENDDQLHESSLPRTDESLADSGDVSKGRMRQVSRRDAAQTPNASAATVSVPAVSGPQPPPSSFVADSSSTPSSSPGVRGRSVAPRAAAPKLQAPLEVAGDRRKEAWPQRFETGTGGGMGATLGSDASEPCPPSLRSTPGPLGPSGRSRSAPLSTRPAVTRPTSLREQRPRTSDASLQGGGSSAASVGTSLATRGAQSRGGSQRGQARPIKAEHRGYLAPAQLSIHIGRATSIQELDEYVSEHRDVMNDIHVSAALSSLVKLPTGLDKPWLMDSLEYMVMEPQLGTAVARIDTMDTRGLSSSLWALATGKRAAGAAFRRVKECLCDRHVLATCNAHDLTNILWACATADSMDPAFAELLCEAVLNLGMHNFIPQALSNVLWACATVGHVDERLIAAVSQEGVRRNLEGWHRQALANTAWAIATLAASSPAVKDRISGWEPVQGMLRLLACQAAACFPEDMWQPLEVSQLVWGLASLDVYDAALLDGIARWVVVGGMAGASTLDWSNLLLGYATLLHSAPALFSASVSLMAFVVPRFSPRELSQLMMAYAVAAPPHALSEFVALVADAFVNALSSANAQDIANAAWALAVAIGDAQRHTRKIARLARTLLNEAEGRDVSMFNVKDLVQLSQLYSELSHSTAPSQGLTAPNGSPSLLQSTAATVWLSNLRTFQPSLQAVQIHGVMRRMGWDATLEQCSPCHGFSVDIEVTMGGVRVAWEVDGPFHFMRNDCDTRDGSTRLRDRGMQRSYGRPSVIINLAKHDWSGKGAEARRQLLLHLVPIL